MELIGRLTADAQTSTAKNDRQVVNFTIAINDSYKQGDQWIKKTLFVQCAYWRSSAIAQYLVKGAMVELTGRLSVDAYIGTDGTAKAKLICHVDKIKLHGSAGNGGTSSVPARASQAVEATTAEPATDDLPF